MTFDEAMRAAALRADRAVARAMRKYAEDGAEDEPEITGYLVGQLDAQIEGQIGGLTWNSQIVRNGSGKAAEEKRVGADLIIHVSLNTPTVKYSKGVLVQAKRSEPDAMIPRSELDRLNQQCRTMLSFTPAAFVFDYARGSMRCGSASRFADTTDRRLYNQCSWTSYRFFLELFRCPIGDSRIDAALSSHLVAFDQPFAPIAISLQAEGQLSGD